jgi:hypothetical protein
MINLVDLLILLQSFFDSLRVINNRGKGQVFSAPLYFIVFLCLLLAVFKPSLWLFRIQVQITVTMCHSSLFMRAAFIVQCFRTESAILHFSLLKFLLLQLNLVFIEFRDKENLNFAHLGSIFATKKLLSLLICEHAGLFRDVRLLFNLRPRLIGIKETLFIVLIETYELHSVYIEGLEVIENLFMIAFSNHKDALFIIEGAQYTIINLFELLINYLGNVSTANFRMVALNTINRLAVMRGLFVFSISHSNTNNIEEDDTEGVKINAIVALSFN